MKKITALTSIGSAMEFYDFLTYILLASFLSQIFFPQNNEFIAKVETLLVFAMGYLVRPLGGMYFGSRGDKYGRKNVFMTTILMMSFATIGIGLLPTYAQVGFLAPILLILLRLIQGIAQGAELPGAITLIAEHANQKHRGMYVSFIFMAVLSGALLCSFTHYLLTTFLTDAEILAWGWRLPFLFGGSVLMLGYFLRKKIKETPAFRRSHEVNYKAPLLATLTHYPLKIVAGIMLTLLAAMLVVFGYYTPSFIADYYEYERSFIYLALSISIFISIFIYPIAGAIADKIGRKKLLIATTMIFILTFHYMFSLLQTNSATNLMLFMIVLQLFICLFASIYPTMLAELFPTRVRYTGIAICYNIAFMLASFIPVLLTIIIEKLGTPDTIIYFFIFIATLTSISALFVKDRTGLKLEN